MTKNTDKVIASIMELGKTKKQATSIVNGAIKGDDSSFDDSTAHQIIHDEAGAVSNCPVCNGTLKEVKKIKNYAMQIITRKVNNRHSPMIMPYEGSDRRRFAETFVDLVKAGEGNESGLPDEIMVLPVGEWNTGEYGKIKITESQIDEMVKNFNDNIRVGVPIDVDHDAKGAAGWVKKLINKGKEGLWASVEWTTYGSQLLKDKIYRFFSPEISLEYVDPETSEYFGPVFIAGTLTNRPLFKELNPLMASEFTKDLTNGIVGMIIKGSDMELKDLLAKDPATLTDEEKAFLQENASELTDEQRTTFGITAPENNDENEDENDDGGDENEDENGDPVKGKEKKVKKVKAQEKDVVTIKASELDAIKKMAEEGVKANRELLKMSVTQEVEKTYLFNEKGGKVMPKGKADLVSLIMSFSDEQKKLFEKVMEAVPDKKVFGELGSDGESDANTASAKVMEVAKKLMASDDGKGLTFKEALDKIKKDQPDLYKEYMDERTK